MNVDGDGSRVVNNLGRSGVVVQNGEAPESGLIIQERKLSISEAAKMMGIGTTSLRRIIAAGRLPVLNILHKALILESDVEAFLRASRVVLTKVKLSKDRRLPALPESISRSRHLTARI